ncbi:MAG: DUF2061 domain-containing protein [Bacteroidetes bacterium]|nr:MAG: DUF2061 domain-containing protein [Bacteroidota bacterium]
MKAKVSYKRHLAKTLTYRIVAATTTFLIAWLFFREDEYVIQKAGGVALMESFVKMAIYYLHERIWYNIDFGIEGERTHKRKKKK